MSEARILLTVIGAEFSKLKRCKVLWSIPICALIPDILVFIMYSINEKYPIVVWEDYIKTPIMLINIFLGIGFFSLLAGFIYSREYEENTVNNLFSYPISRTQFFISKLLVMFILISITLISSFIILVLLGLILKHERLTFDIFSYYGKAYLYMIIMHFALIPIAALLSIRSKKIVPSVILGIGALSLNIIIMNTPLNTLFPWSIPTIFSPHENGMTFTNYPLGCIVLCLCFFVGSLLCIKSIKSDVQ